MQYFYNPDLNDASASFFFDKEESRHIVRVMRKNAGDFVFVTNGKGDVFRCRISNASDNKCMVEIESSEKSEKPSYNLHLAVAPTKLNDRYEWFLEKATEIGISEITPLICQRSERQTVKTERFHKIIQSAMKQSLQGFLPKLNEPTTFKQFMKLNPEGMKYIAHCEETERRSLKQVLKPSSDAIILIGPEGDFTNKEIQAALDNNFMPVSLGTTRLRTETAAIVACHTAALINQPE